MRLGVAHGECREGLQARTQTPRPEAYLCCISIYPISFKKLELRSPAGYDMNLELTSLSLAGLGAWGLLCGPLLPLLSLLSCTQPVSGSPGLIPLLPRPWAVRQAQFLRGCPNGVGHHPSSVSGRGPTAAMAGPNAPRHRLMTAVSSPAADFSQGLAKHPSLQ